MQNIDKLTWNNVHYSNCSPLPEKRWGHRLIQINQTELLLFGGFGGKHSEEGEYLNDLWLFNSHLHQWRQLETKGTYPQPRSNYTIHYNHIDNEVIIFGGGSERKQRFNSLCILNLHTLIWRKVIPRETLAAPWERTYHSGQFVYPYLIVFGGEGVANVDLDDTWTYNILTNEWKELQFQTGSKPMRRRFHASALVNKEMFIIGGCCDKYALLGDVYKVDLTPLFQHNQYQGFKWQKITEKNTLIERWGHSCDVFDGKIYICAGRISLRSDSNQLIELDPSTNIIKEVSVSRVNTPKPRRRHASAIIGHSLLIFGGYDGQYLQDLNFITLSQQKQNSQINLPEVLSPLTFSKKLNSYANKNMFDITIVLTSRNAVIGRIRSSRNKLQKNEFFKYILKQQQQQIVNIELPVFCNFQTFLCIHRLLMNQHLIINVNFDLLFLGQLALALEYFCVSSYMQTIEQHLLSRLNSLNCQAMLQLSILLSFNSLKYKSAEICLRSKGLNQNNQFQNTSNQQNNDLQTLRQNLGSAFQIENIAAKKLQVFDTLIKHLRFDLQQSTLRKNNANFIARTSNRLKAFFSSPKNSNPKNATEYQTAQQKVPKINCLQSAFYFLTSFCSCDPQEYQNNE